MADAPLFDPNLLQQSISAPSLGDQAPFSQQFPDTDLFLKQHRHNGTDATKIHYTDLYAPLPPSCMAAFQVLSNAITVAPKGWTLNHSGTGIYTITHNLGTSAYTIVANAITTICFPVSTAKTSSVFTFKFYDAAGVLTDSDFTGMMLFFA